MNYYENDLSKLHIEQGFIQVHHFPDRPVDDSLLLYLDVHSEIWV
jgi:hypothetical protein